MQYVVLNVLAWHILVYAYIWFVWKNDFSSQMIRNLSYKKTVADELRGTRSSDNSPQSIYISRIKFRADATALVPSDT
jgi:hypothetical protein